VSNQPTNWWQSLDGGAAINVGNIPAFGAGPKFPPASAADCVAHDAACLVFADLGWRVLASGAVGYDAVRHELARHARPFFFLLTTRTPGQQAARAVYWGADGRYGGTSLTDPCRPNAAEDDGKDDRIICIAGIRETPAASP
jgi:hypothetical protein